MTVESQDNNEAMNPDALHGQLAGGYGMKSGWAEIEITPGEPVLMAGLFHARRSEGVLDPLVATAWALESGGEQTVFVSCDLVTIPDELRDAVRARLREQGDGPDPMKVVLHATHTHSAPEIRLPSRIAGHTSVGGTGVELEAMPIASYVAFAAERIAQAVRQAWESRSAGSAAFGMGYVVLGRNRRWINAGGQATRYGLTPEVADSFRHIEGYEDHSLNLMAVYDANVRLTGLVVNIPCPSQLSESEFSLTADFWHETRLELRRRFGNGLYVLPQCSMAGDLCPFPVYEQQAEERMRKLKGRTDRQDFAIRIADEIEGMLPYLKQDLQTQPVLRHEAAVLELPANRLSEADVESAAKDAEEWKMVYERELRRLEEEPGLKTDPRWYVPATDAFRRMHWCLNVAHRFEHQKTHPTLPAEVHVIRLGEAAWVTVPFEYYVDYGIQLKVRSPAVQTFLVQLAGGGTYLPSPRSISGGGYGSVPASNPVGPEGGQQLADYAVGQLRALWS